MKTRALLLLLVVLLGASIARAEDGYRLWLRYDLIGDGSLRAQYIGQVDRVVIESAMLGDSPTIAAAKAELGRGLQGLLGVRPEIVHETTRNGASLGPEGYAIHREAVGDSHEVHIIAGPDAGALYGAFAFLRALQTHTPVEQLDTTSRPLINHRLLNHWDNLNRTIERGTAGFSLWDWFQLPDYVSPRITDYARACASIGINGSVLTNVNAPAMVLRHDYLERVKALADTLRPYHIRVYLTARFSAPIELGGLKTADPLDPEVAAWWQAKAGEIYALIPDFGGFLVKANSEGQPGPQDYGRTHADGANMLADAVGPHGGIVMWRAFVYSNGTPVDRAKQAYDEFRPLDGKFRPNVVIQIKNGPIDFMPREPFHPLFGAMPQTPLALEVQIEKEYTGYTIDLCHLGPLFKEALESDTYAKGPGSTVARVIDGSLDGHKLSVIAGVANTGTDRNWTGNPLMQADWYAFGRLAWDHELSTEQIAKEWTRMTFGNDPAVVQPIVKMLLESREAVVNYEMPLGLHHIMAYGHHFGPGPWVDWAPRADWNSVYYHRADAHGIGFDRTASGSNAVAQYHQPFADEVSNLATCPDKFLLWFHHVPWDYTMRDGNTLWDDLALHYQRGVDSVRSWVDTWDGLKGRIDPQRWQHVDVLLKRQVRDAIGWRDACLQYFQTFSKMPLPKGVEPPVHDLDYYKSVDIPFFPGDPAGK